MKGIATKLAVKTYKGVRESEVNPKVRDDYDVSRLDDRAHDEKERVRATKFAASWMFRK